MIKYLQRTLHHKEMKVLPKFKVGSWIVVSQPSSAEIEFLSKTFTLDAGHLTDALDPHEVPRVEREDKVLYLFFRLPIHTTTELTTQPCLFILAPTFFATVGVEEYQLLTDTANSTNLCTTQKTKALCLLMLAVVNSYYQSLNTISKQVSASLAKLESISNSDIITLIKHERSVNEMLSYIVPLHSEINTLLTGKLSQFFDEDKDLVEDLYLSFGQLIALSKNQMSFIKNTRDAYSTVMTNTLNRVIKLFTSLTVILTVPTIVASFYGMNVQLPGSERPWMFLFIILQTILSVAALVWYFNRKDWL